MFLDGAVSYADCRCDYIVLQCVNGEQLGPRGHAADTDTGGYSRENVTGTRPAFPRLHNQSGIYPECRQAVRKRGGMIWANSGRIAVSSIV